MTMTAVGTTITTIHTPHVMFRSDVTTSGRGEGNGDGSNRDSGSSGGSGDGSGSR